MIKELILKHLGNALASNYDYVKTSEICRNNERAIETITEKLINIEKYEKELIKQTEAFKKHLTNFDKLTDKLIPIHDLYNRIGQHFYDDTRMENIELAEENEILHQKIKELEILLEIAKNG